MDHLRYRLGRLLLLLMGTLDSRREELDLAPDEVMTLLEGAGYGEQDLQDLWQWLHGRWAPAEGRPAWLSSSLYAEASSQSLRLMGTSDQDAVSVPAFGYLLELARTEQITGEQMEALLQFAQLVPGGPLSTGEVTRLLERVVAGERGGWYGDAGGPGERAH